MNFRYFAPRLSLIAAGILVGLIAQSMLGKPEADQTLPRSIDRPLSERQPETLDLPLLDDDGNPIGADETNSLEQNDEVSGIVPPILIPGQLQLATTPQGELEVQAASWDDDFAHGPRAIFESHGHQLCASGCAVSRHPTPYLSKDTYERLIADYSRGPMDETNAALETLLFFGPQTRRRIEQQGVGSLDSARVQFLWNQLKCTQAVIRLRVVDREGNVRSWLDETVVPFDRRHIFDMEVNDVPDLVTSGTVKRVGLKHIWVRL